MPTLASHKRDWEDIAGVDPLWAILSDAKNQFNRWDPDEFFRTGCEHVAALMRTLPECPRRRMLDFGCGVGRLTQAFAQHFAEAVGVDISEKMLELGRRFQPPANCRFLLNVSPDLSQFPDAHFDFVYSFIVLQHIPDDELIGHYTEEFIRVLSPGGVAIFQLPARRAGSWTRSRVFNALRLAHVPADFLYRRLHLSPIRMNGVAEAEVVRRVGRVGGAVLSIQPDGAAPHSRTYTVRRVQPSQEPGRGV